MYNYLDFEKPVADLEGQILELKKLAQEQGSVEMSDEISRLEKRSADALKDIYRKLTPWQKAQIARHPDRPHCLEYINQLFTEFTPLAGDRQFANDEAIQGGFARFNGQPVAILGQEKARTPRRVSSTISARPVLKATARLSASWKWPTVSSCR